MATHSASAIRAEIEGNAIAFEFDGARRRTLLLDAIDGAQVSVAMIFYIFDDDAAGRAVREALIGAARRGVRVRLIIDSFGSSDTPDSFFALLRDAGAEVVYFSRRWRSTYLIRNHQKLVLVDDALAISGGFNVAQSYLCSTDSDRWLDLGFALRGPAVADMVRWFEAIFAYTRDHDGELLRLRRLIRGWPDAPGRLRWLISGPTQRLSPWARVLRADLAQADRLDMVMAYFSPGQGMLRRLGRVARRGRSRILLAALSDNAATIGASRLLYGYLLRKGTTVMEYQPCKLHMKLIVVDDIVYVGSPNFDMRSLFLNVELSLRIEDAALAHALRGYISGLAQESTLITRSTHRANAGWLTRLRWTLAWLVVGVVDYTVARRLNFGLPDTSPDGDEEAPTASVLPAPE